MSYSIRWYSLQVNSRLIFICLLFALPASAKLKIDIHQKYEDELIRWALKKTGLQREPSPEGKTIERIQIVREKIISQSDPWPNFFNWIHVTTRDYVVRQELLVRPGEKWDVNRLEESARNLRKFFILAVVRMVPCRSKKTGQLVLLVVTKDLWSIRLNMAMSVTGNVFQVLEFNPVENNFLGLNKRVGLHLAMRQLVVNGPIAHRLELGQFYYDQRFWKSRFKLLEKFNVLLPGSVPCGGAIGNSSGVWCHPDRTIDGVNALLQVWRPLFSLNTRWGMNVWAQIKTEQKRSFRINPTQTPRGEVPGLSLRTDTYHDYAGRPAIPRVFDIQNIAGAASFTRSFGIKNKLDLTSGLGFESRSYQHPDNFPFPTEVLRWHAANFFPRSDTLLYLTGKLRTYRPRFLRLLNIQGFALSEDFTLGHDLSLQIWTLMNLLSPEQSRIAFSFKGSYTWQVKHGIFVMWLYTESRLQPKARKLNNEFSSQPIGGAWVNTRIEAAARHVSPPLLWGRIHSRFLVLSLHNNIDRQRLFLGGGAEIDVNRSGFTSYLPTLRGYGPDQFEGDGLFAFNVEYRTRPINLWTLHFGFVAFYDGGGVFGGPDPLDRRRDLDFAYHHSVGCGVREHFPQFDKESLRADFAIPLSRAGGSVGTWFSITFKQVF